jgi:hypothetical protein
MPSNQTCGVQDDQLCCCHPPAPPAPGSPIAEDARDLLGYARLFGYIKDLYGHALWAKEATNEPAAATLFEFLQ